MPSSELNLLEPQVSTHKGSVQQSRSSHCTEASSNSIPPLTGLFSAKPNLWALTHGGQRSVEKGVISDRIHNCMALVETVSNGNEMLVSSTGELPHCPRPQESVINATAPTLQLLPSSRSMADSKAKLQNTDQSDGGAGSIENHWNMSASSHTCGSGLVDFGFGVVPDESNRQSVKRLGSSQLLQRRMVEGGTSLHRCKQLANLRNQYSVLKKMRKLGHSCTENSSYHNAGDH